MINVKTSLTPDEKIRAAAAKLIYGTSDAEIALILGVTNHGRVNEAVKEVLSQQKLVEPGYKQNDFRYADQNKGPSAGTKVLTSY